MKVASDFRLSARNALRGKWWEALAAGLIASLLGAVSSSFGGVSFNFDTGSGEQVEGSVDQTADFLDPEFLAVFLTIFGVALL